jgi:hypothetical protein
VSPAADPPAAQLPVARRDLQRLASFWEEFAVPLAENQPVTIGRPLGPGVAALLANADAARVARPDDLVPIHARDRCETARQARVAELLAEPPPLPLSGEDLALAAALHDLCFLGHPSAWGTVFGASRRARLVEAVQASIDTIPLARTPADALGRHALVGSIFRLRRTDTSIRWWSGSDHFRGRPVPERLRTWPRLRRVREDVERIDPLAEASQTDPGLVRALVERTPLTDLLTPVRDAPVLRLRPAHIVVLAHRGLARLVADALVAQGLEQAGLAWVAALRRCLSALDRPRQSGELSRVARLGIQLLVHAHVLAALEPHARSSQDVTTLGRAESACAEGAERARAIRELFALPVAVFERRARLGWPEPGDWRTEEAVASYLARARVLSASARAPVWPELDRL